MEKSEKMRRLHRVSCVKEKRGASAKKERGERGRVKEGKETERESFGERKGETK